MGLRWDNPINLTFQFSCNSELASNHRQLTIQFVELQPFDKKLFFSFWIIYWTEKQVCMLRWTEHIYFSTKKKKNTMTQTANDKDESSRRGMTKHGNESASYCFLYNNMDVIEKPSIMASQQLHLYRCKWNTMRTIHDLVLIHYSFVLLIIHPNM